MKTALKTSAYAYHALLNAIPGMPQVVLDAEKGSGSGGGDEVTKSADELAAEKAASDEAAAAEAAAKELEEAEAAAAAAEDESQDANALKVEKAKLLREVMDKKNKLKDAEKRASDAAAALEAYGGVDPAKVRELLKKESDAEKAAAEAKGDFDRVKAMMAEEHGKEKKTLEERIAALEGQISDKSKTIDTLTVGNDFASSAYIKETLTLTPSKARQLYGAHFEVKDGRTVAFDKPAGVADRKPMVNAAGQFLAFDEAFKRIIEADPDKETLLKAKVNPGSGSLTTQAKTLENKKVTSGAFGVDRIRASLEKSE